VAVTGGSTLKPDFLAPIFAIIRGLTVTILLVCISGKNKTTNAMFLYTKSWLPALPPQPGKGRAKTLFLLLSQANKQDVKVHWPVEGGKYGQPLFFVYKKGHIVY
jgi:hypothetical protein